jgi:hypothetical protein
VIALLAALAQAAPCPSQAAPDADFAVALASGPRPRLVIEVRAGADDAWTEAIAQALDARHVHGVFVAPPNADRVGALASIAARGHDVALALDAPAGVDALGEAHALKKQAKTLGQALDGRPVVAASALPRRTAEAVLGLAGFWAILAEDGTPSARAWTTARFAAQVEVGVGVPIGAWHGACSEPVVAPFRPDGADRATAALAASRGDGQGVARVILDGAHPDPSDADVLGRWLDAVVLPAATVLSATELRNAVIAAGTGGDAEPTGRVVATADVRAAAEAIRGLAVLPRTLPGDLTLTEAFFACMVAAGGEAADTIELRPLSGPRTDAATALHGPVTVPKDQVVALARALSASLPADIPAALPLDGRLFTAAEVLGLFASVARGDDPASTGPIGNPDPLADGLGWGTSGP